MNSNKQLNLFNDDNSTNISKPDLEIDYIENCFNKSESIKLFESLNKRKEISFDEYQDLHKSKKISPLSNHSIRFSHTDDSINSKGYRRYKI